MAKAVKVTQTGKAVVSRYVAQGKARRSSLTRHERLLDIEARSLQSSSSLLDEFTRERCLDKISTQAAARRWVEAARQARRKAGVTCIGLRGFYIRARASKKKGDAFNSGQVCNNIYTTYKVYFYLIFKNHVLFRCYASVSAIYKRLLNLLGAWWLINVVVICPCTLGITAS